MEIFENMRLSEIEQTKCIRELLRDETSVIEIYDEVIKNLRGQLQVTALRGIQKDHELTRQALSNHTMRSGASTDYSLSLLGSWAQFFSEAANSFGEIKTLHILVQGERYGAKHFQDALSNRSLSFFLKAQIRTQFLPRQERHIRTINMLMESNA